MNNSKRLKDNPDRIFDCYCEVSIKTIDSNGNQIHRAWIKRRFPDTYKVKEVLDSVPKFAYPCSNLVISTTTQFSFVLTNIDSKWTFGYCHLLPAYQSCIVLLSQLPWHETFFKILTHISTFNYVDTKQGELLHFLKSLYKCKVPGQPCAPIIIQLPSGTSVASSGSTNQLTFEAPDDHALPSIPQDRYLNEYYNTINIDNMITIFASALNERHILVTSQRLDRLSACVQAINTMLYPMNWQHIFIPVLPADLLAYLQAPMPFLIGVPEPTYKKLKQDETSEAVLLLADDNIVRTCHEDVKNLPPGIVTSIKNHLKSQGTMGDSVSRAFLRALVKLIGGYREALEFNDGERITFNHQRFIATRPVAFQPFLKKMLELQMFRQFIEGRLEMLNAGQGFNDDFEFEVNLYEERTARSVDIQYQDWLNAMKTKSGVLLRSINPSLKLVYKGLKDKSKRAYKDWKVKINESQSGSAAPSFFYSRMD